MLYLRTFFCTMKRLPKNITAASNTLILCMVSSLQEKGLANVTVYWRSMGNKHVVSKPATGVVLSHSKDFHFTPCFGISGVMGGLGVVCGDLRRLLSGSSLRRFGSR